MNFKNEDLRILAVDDVQKNIQVLGQVLRQEGYQINVALNGKQALDIVSKVNPDLILLDIMMPEMDGFEACKRLKADPKTEHIPVIFLTAKTEIDDMVQGFELGAVDYITKPFHPTELLVRVQTHLQFHKLQEALRQQIEENDRLKREQESFVRHELNNSLTPIMGYANLLASRDDLDEKVKGWSDSILTGTEKIIELIESLRQLQNLESNTATLAKEMIDVRSLIQQSVDDLVVAFENKITIQLDLPADPVPIEADGVLLSGVFHNLIKNALEHVFLLDDTQRHIYINLKEDDVWVQVSINNPGPPIPPDRLKTFFDKFNTENKEGGTGLGTTYAFWVTRAHGGRIGVTSSESSGTTVLVHLPVLKHS